MAVQFLIGGISIGWLIGLSSSPVLQIVLGSIITLVTALAATAAGLSEIKGRRLEFNPMLIILLLIGIAFGSPIGILARTNAIFGTDPHFILWRWPNTGLTAEPMERQLLVNSFEQLEPSTNNFVSSGFTTPALFCAITPSQLAELTFDNYATSRSLMQVLNKGKYQTFVLSLNSNQVMSLKTLICDFATPAAVATSESKK